MKKGLANKYKVLLDLINAFGVSGKEMEVRNIITKEIKPHVDKILVDKMGNLIAVKKGEGPRVMIAAHMDEVGLIVKNIEKDGKIRISTIGGIDDIVILNEKVEIVTRKTGIPGIVTTEDISASRWVDKLPKTNQMFIDTGLTKKELIKEKAHIGSFISFAKNAEIISKGRLVSGKALDDRVGCYILIELIKRIKKSKNELVFVFTVQEEVGLYGAKTSTYLVDPAWAVSVDVIDSDDRSENPSKHLGLGPTMTIKDAEMISSPSIDEQVLKLSKRLRIPLQPDVSEAGTTDALSISLSKGGVPTAVLGVPVRNLHTTTSLADLRDIENAIKLIEALLKDPPKIVAG